MTGRAGGRGGGNRPPAEEGRREVGEGDPPRPRGRRPRATGSRCRVLTLGCFLAWVTITRNMAAAGAGEGLALPLYQPPEPVLPVQLPRPNVTRGPRRGRCPAPPPPGCSRSAVCLFALRGGRRPVAAPRADTAERSGLRDSRLSAVPGLPAGSAARGAGTCRGTPGPRRAEAASPRPARR